ncbi:MAG: HD domain-containing protein [Lachnospiraceae bacterium]|nr:HD domain-containing protein [Lachnospiraceae bacterium]
MIDRKRVTDTFYKYVDNYDQKDGKVKLKIDHTIRVAHLSEEIAKTLQLSKEDVDLAWLIGMLHDVGRFEQLRQFGTFIDRESIDHAKLGVSLLFDKGLIRDYVEDSKEDTIIRTAIDNHNVYILSDELEERTLLFCNLIRDADKIDILKVNVEVPAKTVYGISEAEMQQAAITPEVMENYMAHRAVNHQLKKSSIDNIVGHASLVFELVFPKSVALVKEQGYIDKTLCYQSQNEETCKQLERMHTEMQSYIQGVLGTNI